MRRDAGVETGDGVSPAPVRLHVHQRANLQMQLVQRAPLPEDRPASRRPVRALLALVRRGIRNLFRD